MRFSARYLCTVLLTTLSLPTLLPILVVAQTATLQTSKTPRSSISGRVTIKEKGVGGVMVALRKSELQMPYEPFQKATTDMDGFYRIANVPPGNYEVVATVPAFVPADRKDGRAKQILVGDDDNVEGVNFALVRGGVITGRVTDADGRPLIQQQVTIFQENAFNQPIQQPQIQRPIFPATIAQTDDRGIYRVYGLQAGRYKVASGRSDETYITGTNPGRSTYKQVFYPDVADQDKAKVIEVSEGSEANDVDISLGRALQTFAATGRVIDGERGLPMPNVRFNVQRIVGPRVEYVNALAVSNVQGDFIIEGLIPGKYGINLLPNQNQSNELRAETLNFEIIDQDVSGVVVKLVKGASVTGVVLVETEDKAVLAKLSELQIRGFISVPGGGMVSSSASSPIAPDGSFRLAGLASGNLFFNIGTLNRPLPPKGFNIARTERDGIVATRGIEVKDGELVTGVRVILSYGSAIIQGVVTLENGPIPQGARVSVSVGKPGERNIGIRPPVVDERGRFLIESIPAGTYELTTIIGMTTPLAPARVFKRVVTVQDGSTTNLTITVEMDAPPARP
ncbi:MAG TPA: carboxypeptidase-like regulatory domain-containing protein [Pyrinomonadaceae bacterium]|nr:carboxypeptidase-like regulatory domain-containing protein [Pyrinomonadaceae bacterium]